MGFACRNDVVDPTKSAAECVPGSSQVQHQRGRRELMSFQGGIGNFGRIRKVRERSVRLERRHFDFVKSRCDRVVNPLKLVLG